MLNKLPLEVWKDYDHSKEPLDIEVINEWEEDGISFKEVYFTGRSVGNEKVRIYAVYSAPSGKGKYPGILHIHGGGQTVNLKWLEFWSKLGYAALSYNWGGEWPDRERYTLWGALTHANHKRVEPTATDHPGLVYDTWYEWTAVAMRALTFLEAQPEVDCSKLGAFGTSMGGSIVWRIAAVDNKIKAACAIYGCGWEEYAGQFKYDEADKCKEADPLVSKWNSQMAADAYAPYLKAPILYLSGTNDFWGNMDRAFDTLSAVPENIERRYAFNPCFNHHVGAGLEMNLPLWMDRWLKTGAAWPGIPKAEITAGREGVMCLTVSADDLQNIKNVDIYYAIENSNTYFRHWRKADSEKHGTEWSALLPVMDVLKPVFAFANVAYSSGVVLSSNMTVAVPCMLGSITATDLPSDVLLDGSNASGFYTDGWATNSPCTEPVPPVPLPMKVVQISEGVKALALQGNYSLHTYKLGDPKWRGKKGNKLHFSIMCRSNGAFSVVAGYMKGTLHGNESEIFSCTVEIEGKEFWQDIELSESAFKSVSVDKILDDWSKVNYLQLKKPDLGWMDKNIMFSHIKWVQSQE